MISNIILCLLFLVFIGYREFYVYKERQQLLNRIQSTNYVEFRKFETKPEKVVEKDTRPKYNWL